MTFVFLSSSMLISMVIEIFFIGASRRDRHVQQRAAHFNPNLLHKIKRACVATYRKPDRLVWAKAAIQNIFDIANLIEGVKNYGCAAFRKILILDNIATCLLQC